MSFPEKKFNYFSNSHNLKKTQFYVWFLGSKESCVRGRDYVVPVVRELIDQADHHPPPCKVTIQISTKGMRITQSVPSISRHSGKLKMDIVKLLVPAHSITYSSLGPHPYSDVVSCILLLWNPITRCPVHVHVYRCDSLETASVMHSALQMLVDRPENQRALMEVERRLIARGLILIRNCHQNQVQRGSNYYQEPIHRRSNHQDMVHRRVSYYQDPTHRRSNYHQDLVHRGSSYLQDPIQRQSNGHVLNGVSVSHSQFPNSTLSSLHPDFSRLTTDSVNAYSSNLAPVPESGDRVSRLHKAVFKELKEKLQRKGPILLPPKDYSLRFVRRGLQPPQIHWTTEETIMNSSHLRPADYSAPLREPSRKFLPHVVLRKYHDPRLIPVPGGGAVCTSSTGSSLHHSDTVIDQRGRNYRLFGDSIRTSTNQQDEYSKLIPFSACGPMLKGVPIQNRVFPAAAAAYNKRLASSISNIAAAAASTDGKLSHDGNWIIKKPQFRSMQNLRNDGEYEESDAMMYERNRLHGLEKSSFTRERPSTNSCEDRTNYSVICDPFGGKYERKMTVTKFWKDIQSQAKVEDGCDVWYIPQNEP